MLCNKDEVISSNDEEPSQPPQKRTRPSNIINPALASALDRSKISDRNATYVLAAAVESLGRNPQEIALNKESIRRARRCHRESIAKEIRASFAPNVPLTVHWDGKMNQALTTKEVVERLAVLVSGEGNMKLLGVPQLPDGTGEAQAAAVYKLIEEWNLTERVQAMCFDTTASNSGLRGGACVLLQQKLNKDLLSLTCRHHILELIVAKVFVTLIEPSTPGPDIKLFQRFSCAWSTIDRTEYDSISKAESVALELEPLKRDLLTLIYKQLHEFQPRDDYKELLHKE